MRTFTSAGVSRVHLQLGSGAVEIGPSEDGAVHGEVHGDSAEQEAQVQVQSFGGELRVSLPRHGSWFAADDALVRLAVPPGLDLDLVSGSADLTTDVPLGRVSARAGSGDLRLAGTASAQLQTGSGDITVLSVEDEAELGSGSGDIRVDACRGGLALRTASGDVSIGRLEGNAEAKLASGDFRLGATTGSVSVSTASGDIAIGIADQLPAWLDLHSHSGDVEIALPPAAEPGPGDPYVSVYARTGSGDIRIGRA